MNKQNTLRLIAEFRRLPLRGKRIVAAIALALVNFAATFVLYAALGGSASDGKVEMGRYFIRQRTMTSLFSGRVVYFSYAEVSRAAFVASLITEKIFVASVLVAVVCVCLVSFQLERDIKARRAAALSDATAQTKARR